MYSRITDDDDVLSVHVNNTRTGSEVVQVLHSWGQHDLSLQRAGELSLSGHLPVVLRACPFPQATPGLCP